MLLLDEPTGDLDSKNTDIVLDILLKLNVESNITLVMVTHDVNLKYFCHRALKVLDGKIIG
jgi:putative ABC transport system ATP-binding protein